MRKKIAIITGACLLAVLVWQIYIQTGSKAVAQTASSGASPGIPVTGGVAEARDMPIYVSGIGSVQAYNNVTIKSRVDGQIVKVDFTEGQEVKKGDLLFEIDPRPYQAALAQATANKQKDEAQLTSVAADLKRYAMLLSHGNQTQQAYDQQKAMVGQVEAAIAADQAQIDTAQLNLQYASIRSPIDGRTGARLVDIGNLVHATDNTGLVTITQLRPIFVSFTAPQQQFETIRQSAADGTVAAEAYTQGGGKQLATGKLTLIDNQIEQATGTIHLKAAFENQNDVLWPGEFVNLRLVVGVMKNAVTVPARAIQQGPNGDYLFVIKQDNTVEIRNVHVAQTEQDLSAIDKGLAAGERIVVDGQYRLDQGTRVNLQPASASQS